MDKINIGFTKSQFETLLKLIYLGERMHEAHQEAESNDVKDVVQLIFSSAYEMGFKNMIKYASKLGMYFPTISRRGINHLLVDEYDENVFLKKLVQKMAKRDFINKYGEEIIKQMSVEKRMKLEQQFIDKYMDEFKANGIQNLMMKK